MSKQVLGLGYEPFFIFKEGNKAFVQLDSGIEEIKKIGQCFNKSNKEFYYSCWTGDTYPCSQSAFLIDKDIYDQLQDMFVENFDEKGSVVRDKVIEEIKSES